MATKAKEQGQGKAPTRSDDAPKPGDPGMVPANPDAEDPADPTKHGSPSNLTPLDTRSLADATAGRADADRAVLGGAGHQRRRDANPRHGGADVDVPDGGRGLPPLDIDEMTDDQCKAFLLGYGVDAPVGHARRDLAALMERARAAGAR